MFRGGRECSVEKLGGQERASKVNVRGETHQGKPIKEKERAGDGCDS